MTKTTTKPKTANRVSARTTFKIGLVETPIALYKASGTGARAAAPSRSRGGLFTRACGAKATSWAGRRV